MAAVAEGELRLAGAMHPLGEAGRLLIAHPRRHRHRSAEQTSRRLGHHLRGRDHRGQRLAGHAEERRHGLHPVPFPRVEEPGRAGTARIGDEARSAGEAIGEPDIRSAEPETSRAGGRGHPGVVLQQPLELGRRGLDGHRHAAGLELGSARCRALVLPANRRCQRLAALRVPGERGRALGGDAESGYVASARTRLGERFAEDCERALPQSPRVLLHPAGDRKVALERASRAPAHAARPVHHQRAGAGGAQVEADQKLTPHLPPPALTS
jgi:hypothetical protein